MGFECSFPGKKNPFPEGKLGNDQWLQRREEAPTHLEMLHCHGSLVGLTPTLREVSLCFCAMAKAEQGATDGENTLTTY